MYVEQVDGKNEQLSVSAHPIYFSSFYMNPGQFPNGKGRLAGDALANDMQLF